MTLFLLHLTPPVISPPREHVWPISLSRKRHDFKSVSAPPLVSTLSQDAFRLSKTSKSAPLIFSIDEPDQDDPAKPVKLNAFQLNKSRQALEEKIMEGNRVLAAFKQEISEKALSPLDYQGQKPDPDKIELIVMPRSDKTNQPKRFRKIPIPFHSDGFSADLIRNFITGQLNGNFFKNYLSNRFALRIQDAKFSITHFHQDDNNRFTEGSLQFTQQEKAALRKTASAYGYNPNDTQEMAKYYKELMRLQAEITAENQNSQWGIAFQYKKGVFKTKSLEVIKSD